MNISDIFKGEHAMIDEEQLIQLSGLTEKKLRKFNLSQQSLEEYTSLSPSKTSSRRNRERFKFRRYFNG